MTVLESLGLDVPTWEPKDIAVTLSGYLIVLHETVENVPVVGVNYAIYSPNVTLLSYYCDFGTTGVVVDRLYVTVETTRDGTYTYLLATCNVPCTPGNDCTTPTSDVTCVIGTEDGEHESGG